MLCELALAGSAPLEGTKKGTAKFPFHLSLILMTSIRLTAAGGVEDTPVLGGTVLNTSMTDSSLQALAADEHCRCPSYNDDLPLPGLEKRRPVKSTVACK